ncbi:MAG: phage holin family protein [Candidatus Pacebacteria bacterium]|nr:phage holin family protein [Candidatus Paceibacterota bacterium]MBP9842549.1 phage holin family protein [Candidatus Paceibacterota bacterium]
MTILLRILWNALGLLLIAKFIPGIMVSDFYTALIAAVILGILNAVVKPVLVLLTLPITLLTLGLFTLVINAVLFIFAASFIEGFSVESFWYALLGSVLMSIVSTLGSNWINGK